VLRLGVPLAAGTGENSWRPERRSEPRRSNQDRALASRERKRELADPALLEEQQWEAIRGLEDGRPGVRVDAADFEWALPTATALRALTLTRGMPSPPGSIPSWRSCKRER
jgi:hypothetical protein